MTIRLPALALFLAACSGATSAPGRLNPDTADRDRDGWTAAEGDCDDRDDLVYPGAVDPPGDGIDQDCDGSDEAPLRAAGLAAGDLVITEIHREPIAVDSDLAEWFEVKNTSGMLVDLLGLVLRDDDGDRFEVEVPLEVEPDGLVVFGGWHEPDQNGGAPVDISWSGELRLANGEDELVLEVPGGDEIDAVRWDARFPNAPGQSLSLEPALISGEANDTPEAWCLSPREAAPYGVAGWGTPGAENAPCELPPGLPLSQVDEGDLVITEILQNPGLGDPDDGEWIEITNVRGELINLQGLTVADDGGNVATIDAYLPIAPGEFLVFTGGEDALTNGGVDAAWSWQRALGLDNGQDAVIIGFGTTEFDEVEWDNGVDFPDPDGRSMSLDPASTDADANDDGANWCEGQTPFGDGDLGTPGAVNPSCP